MIISLRWVEPEFEWLNCGECGCEGLECEELDCREDRCAKPKLE